MRPELGDDPGRPPPIRHHLRLDCAPDSAIMGGRRLPWEDSPGGTTVEATADRVDFAGSGRRTFDLIQVVDYLATMLIAPESTLLRQPCDNRP